PVSLLPRWSTSWLLGPKPPLREQDASRSHIVLASEPCCLLIPARYKHHVVEKLQQAGSFVAASESDHYVSRRHLHVWVTKLVQVLSAVGIDLVNLMGYGHKQPQQAFLQQLTIAPQANRIRWDYNGAGVDIFAEDNTYDIGLTIQTPGLLQILYAEAVAPGSVLRDSIPRSSPLYSVGHLEVSVFPMLSSLGDGFGTLKIEVVYDHHRWQPLCRVLILLPLSLSLSVCLSVCLSVYLPSV